VKLLRHPLVHFFVVGAAMFALRPWELTPWYEDENRRIVIGAERRAAIRSQLARTPDSASSAAAETQALADAIDEEILYREAVARRLHHDNAVVRERVIEAMRVLGPGNARDDAALFEQGTALGLDRSDLVVRRHLAAAMRLMVTAPARAEAASDEQMQEALAREPQRYRLPATTSLAHVFFRDRAGTAVARVLEDLRAGRDAAGGDAFALGRSFRERTDADLDGVFGSGFAAQVAELPLHVWAGPVKSSYGVHLVRVEERRAGSMPALASVRGRLQQRLYHERADARLRAWLQKQRTRYAVIVQDVRAGGDTRIAALSPEALSLPPAAAIVGD